MAANAETIRKIKALSLVPWNDEVGTAPATTAAIEGALIFAKCMLLNDPKDVYSTGFGTVVLTWVTRNDYLRIEFYDSKRYDRFQVTCGKHLYHFGTL
jgi:hypothetical protein